MNVHKEISARAVAKDIAENPATLFAVANLAGRGKQDVIDFVYADIERMFKGRGPIAFPNLRRAIYGRLQEAKALGPRFDPLLGQTTADIGGAAVTGATAATLPGWAQVVGGIINTVATVGSSIYNTKLVLEAKKDEMEMRERIAAREADAKAAAMVAMMREQQAAAIRRRVEPAGLPSWVLPVGIVAALAVGAMVYLRT